MLVEAKEDVAAGDVLAVVEVRRPSPNGDFVTVEQNLVAPVAAVVSYVAARDGASLPGDALVVRLYRPGSTEFRSAVMMSTVAELAIGMRGTVRVATLPKIEVILTRIEPALGPSADGRGMATLILHPIDRALVDTLLPGAEFELSLDRDSRPANGLSGIQIKPQ